MSSRHTATKAPASTRDLPKPYAPTTVAPGVPAVPTSPAAPPAPSPEQLALERHAAARQRLADHVTTAHRNIASDIGAAKQRLLDIQAKAWQLDLERRRLLERIAEIDLDLREAEKADRIEAGRIEAYTLAQARLQPPPELV